LFVLAKGARTSFLLNVTIFVHCLQLKEKIGYWMQFTINQKELPSSSGFCVGLGGGERKMRDIVVVGGFSLSELLVVQYNDCPLGSHLHC